MSVLVIYMTPNHNTEICASWNDYSRPDVAVTTRRINANSVQLVKLRYQCNFSRSSICTASCYPARVSITSDTGGNLIHTVSEARKAGCCAAVCLLSCPFHGIGCIYTHAREDLHMQQREMSDAQMHTPVCAILDEAKAAGCLQWKKSGGCVVEATDEMWKHHHGLKKRLKVESCRGSQVCSSVFFRWMIFYSVCSAALQKERQGFDSVYPCI